MWRSCRGWTLVTAARTSWACSWWSTFSLVSWATKVNRGRRLTSSGWSSRETPSVRRRKAKTSLVRWVIGCNLGHLECDEAFGVHNIELRYKQVYAGWKFSRRDLGKVLLERAIGSFGTSQLERATRFLMPQLARLWPGLVITIDKITAGPMSGWMMTLKISLSYSPVYIKNYLSFD